MISILLIDDDETEYHLINRMMEDCYDKGFLLRYANSLDRAKTLLKDISFDVILLDDKLGRGVTAQETVPDLKAITNNVPLIIISSIVDAHYLRDKTILNVYDIVDKFHLQDKMAQGLLLTS
jgi:DNA-binding NtrC family response regulator